jgi:signal transduction histidine kinase
MMDRVVAPSGVAKYVYFEPKECQSKLFPTCVAMNRSSMNRHILLLLLIGCLCAATSISTAQTIIQKPAQADSLRSAISTAKDETTRINAMNELSNYFWYSKSQLDSAMTYAQEAHKMAERSHYRKGLADALNNMGAVYRIQGKYKEALDSTKKALTIHEELGNKSGIAASLYTIAFLDRLQGKYADALENNIKSLRIREEIGDKQGIAALLHNIAYVYLSQGKYTKASENNVKSLRIREEIGDKVGIAASLNSIAIVCHEQGNYSEALEYYFKSLRIREEIGDKRGVAWSLNNIAETYDALDNHTDALANFIKSLRILEEIGDKQNIAVSLNNIALQYSSQGNDTVALAFHIKSLRIFEEIGDKFGIANSLATIAGVNQKQKKYAEALENFMKSLRIFEEIGDNLGIAGSLNNIGNVYRLQRKFDEARTYSFHSLRLADSIGAREKKKDALESLSICYDSLGQHKKAFEYYRQFVALKDSMVNAENLEKTAKLKEGYDAEKREQQIQVLQIQQAQENIIRNALIAGALVLAGVAVVFARGNSRRKRDNARLAELNDKLFDANEELSLLTSEKDEILNIVTHGLKSNIFGMRSLADSMTTALADDAVPKNAVPLAEMSRTISRSATQMFSLVTNLLTVNTAEQGLLKPNVVQTDVTAVLHKACEQFRDFAAVKNITLREMSPNAETGTPFTALADEQMLREVLENLLSNAVKYSPQGKSIDAVLQAHTKAVRIEIRDEGEGISPSDMPKLFGKYARLTAQPTGGEHSTGLGLSIVKKMVEAMNGKVWCESELGKGATFIVELPAA